MTAVQPLRIQGFPLVDLIRWDLPWSKLLVPRFLMKLPWNRARTHQGAPNAGNLDAPGQSADHHLDKAQAGLSERRLLAFWLTSYGTVLVVVVATKLFALLAVGSPWRDNLFYTAAAAGLSSYREILLAAAFFAALGLLWQRTTAHSVKVVIVTVAAVAVASIAVINLVNAELLPHLGAPVSIQLIHASNIFEEEHGRSAILSWISPEAWQLGALVIASPILTYLLVRTLLAALPLQLLFGSSLLLTAAVAVAGALSEPTPEAFQKSGTLHFLRSLALRSVPLFDADLASVGPWPAERIEPAIALAPRAGAKIRNVILIVLDSVGAPYVDQYGGTHGVMRHISSLSSDSVVVTDAYANTVSSTLSTGVILNSRYAALGYRAQSSSEAGRTLPLPLLLSRSGLRTAFFHSSDTRFDEVDKLLTNSGFSRVSDFRGRRCPEPLLDDGWGALATSDRCTFQQMKSWIISDAKAPFFATVWTFGTHYPYYASPRTIAAFQRSRAGDSEKARYLAAIFESDQLIGQLVDWLVAQGLFEETLVIITSDHGDVLDRRGTAGRREPYEEVISVPLIFISPLLQPGRLERLTAHIDLAPTIADALGMEPHRSWEGNSLFEPQLEKPVFFQSDGADLALGYRFRNLKVVHRVHAGETRVFDLAADPDESANRTSNMSEAELRKERNRLFAWAAKVNGR